MQKDEQNLQLALANILKEKEQFMEYVSVTTDSVLRPDNINEADKPDLLKYSISLAQKAVLIAQDAFSREGIPFRPPDDFSGYMFRPPSIMERQQKMSAKKQQLLIQKQEKRRQEMEKRSQNKLQHDTRLKKHLQVKMQREIIETWKNERKRLQNQGVADTKLPTLEDIEKKYQNQQKLKRAHKNSKYGGKKAQIKSQKQIKHLRKKLKHNK